MKIVRVEIPFENGMTPLQKRLGWIYVALHAVVLPWLLRLYAEFSPNAVNAAEFNLLYYGIGVLFVLCVMLRFLRRGYDVLLDKFRLCLLSVLLALIIDYAMSGAAALILLLAAPDIAENPNAANIMTLAAGNFGLIKGLTIFIAPIVEEVLFRGVVFGSIREKSRGWAYVVSAVLFAGYNVLSFAVGSGDLSQLLYIIEYIPVAVALAAAYEHSGSIWTPIFMHMGINAVSFSILNVM